MAAGMMPDSAWTCVANPSLIDKRLLGITASFLHFQKEGSREGLYSIAASFGVLF
jgi:hypothetical protein